jgi:hypothetical protein
MVAQNTQILLKSQGASGNSRNPSVIAEKLTCHAGSILLRSSTVLDLNKIPPE